MRGRKWVSAAAAVAALVAIGCGSDDKPPPQQGGYGQPPPGQQGHGQPPPPGYGQPPPGRGGPGQPPPGQPAGGPGNNVEIRRKPDGTCVKYEHQNCTPHGTCSAAIPQPIACPPGY